MIPYKTLEAFKARCEEGLEQVKAQRKSQEEELATLKRQEAYIEGEIYAIEQLMSMPNQEKVVELPFAGDEIEKLFEERLETYPGMTPGEVYKERRDVAYRKEAMDAVEMLDAVNRDKEADNAASTEDNSPPEDSEDSGIS